MKRTFPTLLALFTCFMTLEETHSQTIASLENLSLGTDTFWNGSAQPLGAQFTSGNIIFPNYYDTSFGGFWASGWAYSSVNDSSASGFGNLYAAKAYTGVGGSNIYAVGQQNAMLTLTGNAAGKIVSGLYVTNGTYASNSMRDGDGFAKKFGGFTGNDPDWFRLTIKKYLAGSLSTDSIDFYLADYRFTNNSQDYIVTSWEWVYLEGLGNVDSLLFILSSSDTGAFGMNTPGFFCVDDITTADYGVGIAQSANVEDHLEYWPVPVNDYLNVTIPGETEGMTLGLYDMTGKLTEDYRVESIGSGTVRILLSDIAAGIYILQVRSGQKVISGKFTKM